MAVELDKYDMNILRALARDGRMSWRNLADDIGLSLTPTLRRVRRLESEGYIEGYSAHLDEKRLVGAMSAFVSVTLERQVEEVLARFESRVADLPEVMSCFLMSGGADYTLRVVVRDLDHYQQLLSKLTRIQGVAHIQSSFALKSVIRRRAPIL
ncbi:Lrp/AsnC family transcriptional regulator [Solimonas sp. K1W22B-7]|uniref:Lrp/AsnC family transcriptional regulator n=1 Tax=Solimonas sp. K1W22B-7 TaxID=2303331 RepID=UPI000E33271D|nr:Lrp/AsnC family transcriptional regulator [Solimonas sp. K1W22B-7]AXQ28487.1 Lrp/AsnC family transcriptional regulator [Solimonas sp. K1W22B-7]